MISFVDIFKKKFLEMAELADTTFLPILISFLMSFAVGIFIFFIYKKCYSGVLYSHTFNVTLTVMTMVTTMIIVTISSNLVLSLGMVGALSIVRFRTAIKDPTDLLFLFWAVASGIATGARIYSVVVVGTLIIGLSFIVLTKFKTKKTVYLLVINYKEEAYPDILKVIGRMKYVIRSKMAKNDMTELTLEVYLKENNTVFVNMLSEIENVNNVALVSYNGDFA